MSVGTTAAEVLSFLSENAAFELAGIFTLLSAEYTAEAFSPVALNVPPRSCAETFEICSVVLFSGYAPQDAS